MKNFKNMIIISRQL